MHAHITEVDPKTMTVTVIIKRHKITRTPSVIVKLCQQWTRLESKHVCIQWKWISLMVSRLSYLTCLSNKTSHSRESLKISIAVLYKHQFRYNKCINTYMMMFLPLTGIFQLRRGQSWCNLEKLNTMLNNFNEYCKFDLRLTKLFKCYKFVSNL